MTTFYRATCDCGDGYETPSEQAAEDHADNHEIETGHRCDVVSFEEKP